LLRGILCGALTAVDATTLWACEHFCADNWCKKRSIGDVEMAKDDKTKVTKPEAQCATRKIEIKAQK